MIAARALAAIAIALAIAPAAHADELAAIAIAADPFASVLVGPSGQVWEPDGHGGWVRRREGGVAADVGGAVLTSTLVVTGRASPPYRLEAHGWQAVRLGERGKTIAGRGPRAAIAIGRNLFVWKAGTWVRVGVVPAAVVAVWAASDSKLYVAGADRIWRLAGKRFVDHAPTTAVTSFGTGAAPLALTADGQLVDVATRKTTAIVVDGTPLAAAQVTTAADGTPWVQGTRAGAFALARRLRGGWQTVVAPAVAADDRALGLAIAADGAVVMPMASGAVWVWRDGSGWTAATLADGRAAGRPAGPGPARMP